MCQTDPLAKLPPGGSYLLRKYDVFRQSAEFFKRLECIVFKYGLTILRREITPYVNLECNKMFQNPTKHYWIKYMKTLLCSSKFSGVWERQLVHHERKFLKHFEQRCRDMYYTRWF